ncbi:pilus assembly FimT family protein [Marinovum sp.]|uniref:pilus assembly FimT family protein n=1 Tax=Marinovum sp. TaxID=2024839 RepID=UPI003A8E326F
MAGRVTPRRTPESGFSLVELMIVVTVLSILSLGAVLALNLRDPQGARDVAWLERTFATTQREAILTRQQARLAIGARGVTRLMPDAETADWVASDAETPLDALVIATPGYGAQLRDDGSLMVTLLPDGRTSAFDLRLEAGRQLWSCAADGWGGFACRQEG